MGIEQGNIPDIPLEMEMNQNESKDILESAFLLSNISDDFFASIDPEQRDELQQDLWNFLEESMAGEHRNTLDDLNISSFDKDGEAWLDAFEFKAYIRSMEIAIQAIILTGWLDEYKNIRLDGEDQASGWIQENIESRIHKWIDWAISGIWDFTDIPAWELEKMKEMQFDILSKESWIVIGAEIWEWISDLVKLLVNIIWAGLKFDDYLELRTMRNSDDPAEKKEAELRIQEMIEKNPALALAEISLDAFKQLFDTIMSGTNEWVALGLVTAISSIAWGAWAVRAGAQLGRRSKVLWDRNKAPSERSARDTEIRNNLKTIDTITTSIDSVTSTIDSVISTAWVWLVAKWMWTMQLTDTAANDSKVWERKITHSDKQSFINAGGDAQEYWYVDTNGQLHVNEELLANLPEWEKRKVMKEFIAHERAHQVFMNLPKAEIQKIDTIFEKNWVYDIQEIAQKYELNISVEAQELDLTNEILAHMIGRIRVGKDVPETFIASLKEAWYTPKDFWINTARHAWDDAWIMNEANLQRAAMTSEQSLLPKLKEKYDSYDTAVKELFSFDWDGSQTPKTKDELLAIIDRIDFESDDYKRLMSDIGYSIDNFDISETESHAIIEVIQDYSKTDTDIISDIKDEFITIENLPSLMKIYKEIQETRKWVAPEKKILFDENTANTLDTSSAWEKVELDQNRIDANILAVEKVQKNIAQARENIWKISDKISLSLSQWKLWMNLVFIEEMSDALSLLQKNMSDWPDYDSLSDLGKQKVDFWWMSAPAILDFQNFLKEYTESIPDGFIDSETGNINFNAANIWEAAEFFQKIGEKTKQIRLRIDSEKTISSQVRSWLQDWIWVIWGSLKSIKQAFGSQKIQKLGETSFSDVAQGLTDILTKLQKNNDVVNLSDAWKEAIMISHLDSSTMRGMLEFNSEIDIPLSLWDENTGIFINALNLEDAINFFHWLQIRFNDIQKGN